MTVNLLQQTLDVAVEPSAKLNHPRPVAPPATGRTQPTSPQKSGSEVHRVALSVAHLPPRSIQPMRQFPIDLTSAVEPTVLAVQSAMQRLVKRIMTLQKSGRMGADIRSSVLLPYVQTETQELIKALHRRLATIHVTPPAKPAFPSCSTPSMAECFSDCTIESPPSTTSLKTIRLKALASWLHWSTSRSSPDVMRLLNGQMARVLCPNHPWQTGTLRLVPFLSLRYPTDRPTELFTVDLTIDLAPDAKPTPVPRSVLSQDTRIYLDAAICQQPASVSVWLSTLQAHIQQTTPSIAPYFQGIAAQVRLPRRSWHSGIVQLHYRLEFIPLLPTPKPLSPLIKFADDRWLQQYDAAIHHQQVSRTTWELTQHSIANNRLPSATRLVAAACTLSDHLQNDLAIVSRLFAPQELELNELVRRLAWGLLHSSYEGMQLLRGIPVTVLSSCLSTQPQSIHQQTTGQLRFAVYLHLRSPHQSWRLDLISGDLVSGDLISEQLISRQSTPSQHSHQAHLHPSNRGSKRLPPTAIVQSSASAWCQTPRSLHQLQTQLWQQISAQTPELKLLLQPTSIEVYRQQPSPDFSPGWRSGTMQLKGRFEFVATPV